MIWRLYKKLWSVASETNGKYFLGLRTIEKHDEVNISFTIKGICFSYDLIVLHLTKGLGITYELSATQNE